jgi:hypothetical protein
MTAQKSGTTSSITAHTLAPAPITGNVRPSNAQQKVANNNRANLLAQRTGPSPTNTPIGRKEAFNRQQMAVVKRSGKPYG